MQISSRHHLRADARREVESTLADAFGMAIDGADFERVEFTDSAIDLVLVDGAPVAAYYEAGVAPTVRGANRFPPTRRVVTVDAGAVSFVSDGADVMRPGIVEADPAIAPGDLVVIAEETHGKVLAIGRSREAGADLLGDSGKVIDSVHHVGDVLYGFSP